MKTKEQQKEFQRNMEDILNKYNLSQEDFDLNLFQLMVSMLILMRAAHGFKNKDNVEILTAAGELMGKDNTTYQVHISLQPNKNFWINEDEVKPRKLT